MRTNTLEARRFAGRLAALDPLAALLPAGNPRYLTGDCTERELARIGAADRVLVLGGGSAAVDAVLALDRAGHRGTITLVMPRGLLLPVRERPTHALAGRFAALRAEGRLDVCAGEVNEVAAYEDTFVVDILPRGRTLHRSERFDWIVNPGA